jgi:hypothetical protein
METSQKKRNPIGVALNPHQRRRVEETRATPEILVKIAKKTGVRLKEFFTCNGAMQGIFVHCATKIFRSSQLRTKVSDFYDFIEYYW